LVAAASSFYPPAAECGGHGYRLGAIIKPFFYKLQLESQRSAARQNVAKMNGTGPWHSYRVNGALSKTVEQKRA
jgi:hypothetical protein